MPALGRIAIFASGSGSTFAYLVDEGREWFEVVALFCNRPNAGVIEKAAARHVPVVLIEQDGAWKKTLEGLDPDLVCLAGYLKPFPEDLVDRFRGKVLNVHPALLPKFGGKGFYGHYVHEAVIASGEKLSGASVHLVDEGIDTGMILAQSSVDVREGMDAEALAQAVQAVEKPLYLETIRKVLEEQRESTN